MRRDLQRVFLCGVSLCAAMAATAAERACKPPPAAEQVRLRAACAAAGEQILASNYLRSAVYQEQFSRYSAQTGRCYVEMRVETMPDDGSDRVGRYLYDGMTKELLAYAVTKKGKKSGRVYDLNHRTLSFENSGFDDASEYIYRMMADDG